MVNQDLWLKEFPLDMSVIEIISKFDSMRETQVKKSLRAQYCDWLVTVLSKNFIKYDFPNTDFTDPGILSLLKNIEKLGEKEYFFWAYYHFLKQDYAQCKKNIHLLLNSLDYSEQPFGENDFVDLLIVPFKNAFDGFWSYVASELRLIKVENGISELCNLVELYYNSTSNDEILMELQTYIRKYPDYHISNELIGYTYYSMSMWNNAIAYLERIEEARFFYQDEIYWMLAWSHGKIKDLSAEEAYYRKCQSLYPEREYLLNNLGYCLLKQKQYSVARGIFEQCIENKIDLPYAANNYIRVLIATGRHSDAKKFVRDTDCRISKSLKDKVDKLANTNARIKKDTPITVDAVEEENPEISAKDIGVKRQQFSNEKLLEDELTARIESGMPVFGLNLKIYKRHGEYGRQYIIPVGRLDLLCEDTLGNLYIIELKKDSGYDDAYKQTADYLDWFENSERFRGKQIFGIICLNNPTAALINKVHSDKRMKLFEYQISYTEL